jgi:hypothetical protein
VDEIAGVTITAEVKSFIRWQSESLCHFTFPARPNNLHSALFLFRTLFVDFAALNGGEIAHL